jgi:hypothetical protein
MSAGGWEQIHAINAERAAHDNLLWEFQRGALCAFGCIATVALGGGMLRVGARATARYSKLFERVSALEAKTRVPHG